MSKHAPALQAETRADPGRSLPKQGALALVREEIRRSWVSYIFIGPFFLLFLLFIVLPILAAIGLSFTSFNAIELPKFVGLQNYMALFTQDLVFWQHAIPNTFLFAIIVGPVGYLLSFVLAWLIAQLPRQIRGVYTLAMYAPSMTAGIAMSVVWLIIFSGDRLGYLNSFLLNIGYLNEPRLWTTDTKYIMDIMIIVSLWGSMGVGFLAMLAGIQNVDRQLYEAGRIDGIRSRLEEIWYITIPSMKPQMLFGAVMAVVGTLKAGAISVEITGSNPSPNYAGHLMINHIDDYGFIRFEMGYASAISVILLVIIYLCSRLCWKLFGSKGE
ncbi:sugar ABC transporter permease [Paenibacillus aurantius]|uniref:Sugar ABC transporter permease n=1 Tax=Paenibacillus aurantius TaxID=2918900 RepID=A0AA96L8J5_9BACL|nr:sugar ABC transporter permease [Paenibacillus aurantius]WNQ08992.1 sugar ABC transporter permease [Paenibacillus aurantius]